MHLKPVVNILTSNLALSAPLYGAMDSQAGPCFAYGAYVMLRNTADMRG
jgi:hypothetical protein